jgi:hypothetical protein
LFVKINLRSLCHSLETLLHMVINAITIAAATPAFLETGARGALRFGPLRYHLARMDQVLPFALSPAALLSRQWRPNLLDGVLMMMGSYASRQSLLAIPNFARRNRGGLSVGYPLEQSNYD